MSRNLCRRRGSRRTQKDAQPEMECAHDALTSVQFSRLPEVPFATLHDPVDDEVALKVRRQDIVDLMPIKDPESLSQVRQRSVQARQIEDDEEEEDGPLQAEETPFDPSLLVSDDDNEGYHTYTCKGVMVSSAPAEHWHVVVLDICRDEKQGQCYVKLQWFYSAADCQVLISPSAGLRKFQSTMGPLEYLRSDHTTINEVERISAMSKLVMSDLRALNLPPISHNVPWSRGPIVNIRPKGSRLAAEGGDGCICLLKGCRYDRKYVPADHVIRYCQDDGCQRWYHAACLSAHMSFEDITPMVRPQSLYRGRELQEGGGRVVFANLLLSPIRRAPADKWVPNGATGYTRPLSFEIVICAARALWESNRIPLTAVDDDKWFRKELAPAGVLTREERKRRAAQFVALPIPGYYICPTCGAVV
ncbi:hypothetical protein L226DRAFT_573753 [Lentinus tigrinus ALCF2SS1-7]|uniref:uncharacterized protein n=1 Tax=Lentinus tigrinus ALCF2SS1-7 TaxID=1328758 RepID=UPI001165E617|nr:hypothetical protein L226DRAFT_573753 [Lentinus tigrinus ALCF2SS1-7]